MVDAEDLKSFGHCDRVGSSPTIPTTLRQGYGWQATKPLPKHWGAGHKKFAQGYGWRIIKFRCRVPLCPI